MKKETLLAHIQEAIKTEESANAIYFKHLDALSLRSNVDETRITEMRSIIAHLIDENNRHKQILQSLLEKINKEPLDAY